MNPERFAVCFVDLDVYQLALVVEAARAVNVPLALDPTARAAVRAIGKSTRTVPRSGHGARAVASLASTSTAIAAPERAA